MNLLCPKYGVQYKINMLFSMLHKLISEFRCFLRSFSDQCTVTRTYLFLHKFWFFSTIYYFGNWAFIAVSSRPSVRITIECAQQEFGDGKRKQKGCIDQLILMKVFLMFCCRCSSSSQAFLIGLVVSCCRGKRSVIEGEVEADDSDISDDDEYMH